MLSREIHNIRLICRASSQRLINDCSLLLCVSGKQRCRSRDVPNSRCNSRRRFHEKAHLHVSDAHSFLCRLIHPRCIPHAQLVTVLPLFFALCLFVRDALLLPENTLQRGTFLVQRLDFRIPFQLALDERTPFLFPFLPMLILRLLQRLKLLLKCNCSS